MNGKQKAIFRNLLLVQLHDASPCPAAADMILQGARLAGFGNATERDVEAEMSFAVDDGHVKAVPHPKSATLKRWRLTAAGRDYLESEELV